MKRWRASAAYRIAFTYAAAFALTTLLLGIGVYVAADAEFRHQRDRAIADEIARVAGGGNIKDIARDVAERSRIRGHDAYLYALFDAHGRRVAGRLDAAVPVAGEADITFRDPHEGSDVARARTVALAGGYRLTVGVDAEPIERIDATILTLFGIASGVMLAVGIVGALLLGGYLRRRLGAIGVTAEAIVAGELDRRVVIGPSGDEFDQLGTAINAMLDRIAQLMENLRQVSSDVAHDLRTPLMRLRHQLEQVGTVDGAAERAIAQGDALLTLFAALLRIAEVEAGHGALAREDVDLSDLLTDVAEAYQPALEDSGHGLSWSIAPGVQVRGDRDLLGQALVNLLDNARIHTPGGTRVTIELIDVGPTAALSVSDDGPGVPEADRGRIIQRFVRGEASRTTPGNGLGLSLVNAIVAAHGGSLSINDASPGLCVSLTLPRTDA